ncbi:hypothetical protein, partial [Roseovarius gahaiensis]|uniref:hypothetical protein n=1 Tax=Roseovarius gahaiensis TaxID=2716691 RepID=UPI001E605A44
ELKPQPQTRSPHDREPSNTRFDNNSVQKRPISKVEEDAITVKRHTFFDVILGEPAACGAATATLGYIS